MSPPLSDDVSRLPDLMPQLAADDALAPDVARTIARLLREVTPVELWWLDERVRRHWYVGLERNAWQTLAPAAVSRVAQAADFDPGVVGLLASHANGYVRAAALDILAHCLDGRELPFLALRANDWVQPVATQARALLMRRLRPENRDAVLAALPFIVRLVQQRRRDHGEIRRALGVVLLSDGGDEVLARTRGDALATPVRRVIYELLATGATVEQRRRIIDAARIDADAVIRTRAIGLLGSDDAGQTFAQRGAILEEFLRGDPAPAVRRLALSMLSVQTLSVQMPDRIAGLFPQVLLDRAASVRSLARYVARTHQLPLVPRDIYVQSLASLQSAAAIAGVDETGTRADADLIAPFVSAPRPRQRRAALGALARLDAERAISSAIDALADEAASVRARAIDVLSSHAHLVNFERLRLHPRPELLRLFARAPKWEAAALMLEALADSSASTNANEDAAALLDRWVENFNRTQTQPTAMQLERIRGRLDAVASRLPAKTATFLRFATATSGTR